MHRRRHALSDAHRVPLRGRETPLHCGLTGQPGALQNLRLAHDRAVPASAALGGEEPAHAADEQHEHAAERDGDDRPDVRTRGVGRRLWRGRRRRRGQGGGGEGERGTGGGDGGGGGGGGGGGKRSRCEND